MKRELQDYVWSVLPKEFKEEVKYKYNKTKTKKIRKECDLGFLNAHEGMFGAHNLTSDVEGGVKDRAKEPKPAEPKEDKRFDNILKEGFHEHNRLHIAAQIVVSMIGSDDWTTWRGSSNKEIWHNMAKSSLEIADALIAEAEKGGEV